MTTIIKIRRDTAANWTSSNPILALGEPGYETDTYRMKVGDGTTVWTSLPYNAVGNATYATTAGSATTANTATTATSATTAGTVTTAAQPNVTSVGTLTGVTATGTVNFTGASNVSLGAVGNLHITGGSAGQVLVTNGAGELSWSTAASSYGNANVATYLPTYDGNVLGLHVTSNTQSTSPTTGALLVEGGIGSKGDIHTGGVLHASGNIDCNGDTIFVGPFADATGITGPVIVGFAAGDDYIQSVLKNSRGNGSADYTATANEGNETEGWTSLGIAGSTFNDPNYTITGPGDGYVLAAGLLGSGGNLVLATGATGTVKDIVFATGGFLSSNEFARIDHANNTLHLTKTGASLTFPDGTEQTTAYTGGGVSLTVGGSNGAGGSTSVSNVNEILISGIVTDLNDGLIGITTNGLYRGAHVVELSEDGDLFLAANGKIIGTASNNNGSLQWVGNSSGDGGGYTTMRLVPDNTVELSDQYLIVDPTGPNHIHIRPGGTQDQSTADFYLGGEKNFVRISDNGNSVRMQNETLQTTGSYSFNTSLGFSSAAWQDDGFGGYQVIIYDPTVDVFTAVWGLDTTSQIQVYDGSTYYTLVTNGNTGTPGGGPITFGVLEAPPSSPTSIQNLDITNYATRTNYAEVSGTDFTVDVYDDVRITGSDIVTLRNRSNADPVTIVTDYDNNQYTWSFGVTGNLELPGNIISFNTFTVGTSNSYVSYDTSTGPTEVVSAGNVILTSNSASAHQWTFDSTGKLNLPGNTYSPSYPNKIYADNGIVLEPTYNASGNAPSLYVNYNDGIVIEPITNDYSTGGSTISLMIAGTYQNTGTLTPGPVHIDAGYNANTGVEGTLNLGALVSSSISIGKSTTTINVAGNTNFAGTVTSTGKIGYSTGGTATQSSLGQSVTVNQLTGKVTMASKSWNVGDVEVFLINCNKVSADDFILAQAVDSTNSIYFDVTAFPFTPVPGSIQVYVRAKEIITEAVIIKFFIMKAPVA